MAKIIVNNPRQVINGGAKKYYFKVKGLGGPKGDKGDKGDTGSTGPQGPQGNAATVSVGSTTTLPVGYDATVENVGSIYNAVLNFGIPQGPQGIQGERGEPGQTGQTGPRGPQGERGTNATVYIGTTTTLNPGSQATVYNSGTDSNAVLNFGIPRGEKGETGATGATGATGPAGQDGQNFTPTIVDSLPTTGEQDKLYLTPKAHTTQTATGNPITATITEQAGKMESFKLDGDTTQYTYNGGNLFDSTIEQGVISSADGTNTGDTTTNRVRSATQSVAGYGGQITISAETTISGKTLQFVPRYYDANGNYVGFGALTWQSIPTTLTPTPSTTRYIRLLFRLSDNSDITPEQITNVQITGATSAPNPDYPQAVNTVTGTQTIEVVGKNLLNTNMLHPVGYSETINGVTYTMMEDGGIKMKGTAGSTASSFTFLGVSWSDTTNQIPLDGSKAYMSSITRPNSAYRWYLRGYVNGAVATLNSNLDSLAISNCTGITYAMLQVSANQAVDAVVYPQVELGSTATSFAKYSKQTLPIDLGTTELCKLGDYQDYIYKDGESWKVHKATGVKNYTGESSENWSYFSSSGYAIWRSTDVPTNMQSSAITTDSFKSNNFTYWVNDGTSVSVGVTEGHFGFNAAATNINFKYDSLEPNLSDWTTWLSTHNTSVYYPLATATDTTITDQTLIAQLEAVRTALLQNGANTITNTATGTNLAGDMEVGYYGYNPTNRYDKWLWLDINNEYEQIGS